MIIPFEYNDINLEISTSTEEILESNVFTFNPFLQMEIITNEAEGITANSAELSGFINTTLYIDGLITGFEYSTQLGVYNETDYISAGFVDDNTIFPTQLTGLISSTTYYIRAYVITSDLTLKTYGNEISFTTLSE